MNGEHPNSPAVPTTDPLAYLPKPVSDVDMAFGGIDGLMPKMSDIPDELPSWSTKLFNDWFYAGLKSLELTPKPGIDKQQALRHIRTIMGSFSPKHEHKEAAVAFFLSQWFEPAKWEAKEFTL